MNFPDQYPPAPRLTLLTGHRILELRDLTSEMHAHTTPLLASTTCYFVKLGFQLFLYQSLLYEPGHSMIVGSMSDSSIS